MSGWAGALTFCHAFLVELERFDDPRWLGP